MGDELTYRLFFVSLAIDVFLPVLRIDKYTRIALGILSALLLAVALLWPSIHPHIPSPLALSLSSLVMNAWAWFVLILFAPFCLVLLPLLMPQKKQAIIMGRQDSLIIHSAVYGLGSGQDCDVTQQVRELIVNGELHIEVRPETFLMDDPYPNKTKRFRVVYSYENKERVSIQRTDYQRLNLPLDAKT